ncbi:hypothetical protein Hypma_012078 [Hypsizygus marmoreus]|uniref:Uncharacterized protein n=1 Tax=Hypsizygus marmoreus TaxID=39966 RepID=A0A369JHW7_HYPMA|nr:hypothetical protein Hypma_012078 [Hypsizygus marmoreus]
MAPLLQNVLRLYDIPSLGDQNGKVTFDKRDKHVSVLNASSSTIEDPRPTVVGLKTSVSDQDDEPIVSHRQKRQGYPPTCERFRRSIMNTWHVAKRDMFNAFVNKELGEELRLLLKNCIPDVLEDDAKEDTGDKGVARKKSRGRKKKPIIVHDDELLPPARADSSMLASDGDISMATSDGDPLSDAPDRRHGEARRGVHNRGLRLALNPSNALTSRDRYPSSPGSPGDSSPPAKRPRQGTIGADGRAQILASPAPSQEHDTAPVTALPASRVSGWEDDTSSTTMVPSISPKPPQRTFLVPDPTQQEVQMHPAPTSIEANPFCSQTGSRASGMCERTAAHVYDSEAESLPPQIRAIGSWTSGKFKRAPASNVARRPIPRAHTRAIWSTHLSARTTG